LSQRTIFSVTDLFVRGGGLFLAAMLSNHHVLHSDVSGAGERRAFRAQQAHR